MSTRDRFAEVVRRTPVDVVTALTLLGAEAAEAAAGAIGPPATAGPTAPDLVLVLAGLDALAAGAAGPVAALGPAEGMRRALGEQAGFAGFAEDYDDVRSSLLPAVLDRRRGLPILLAVVWVEVARRLDVPAHCVNAPGHVLASVDGTLVDPFHGGRPAVAPPGLHDLGPMDPVVLLARVLANIRALAARTQDTRTGLWATELALLLPRHPLELRREHGRLLVRAGRHVEGARELEEFATVAPAPHDEDARREARMARAQLN